MSNSLRPHESQHARPPCPSPSSGVHSNSCPLSWWCHPAISSSVVPFSSCPEPGLREGKRWLEDNCPSFHILTVASSYYSIWNAHWLNTVCQDRNLNYSLTDKNIVLCAFLFSYHERQENDKCPNDYLNKREMVDQDRCEKVKVLATQSCLTFCDPTDCSPPGSSPLNSPVKNTGVGSHSLL